AARPASDEAQTTLPPSAATWAAKVAGAEPVNETISRPVAATPALDATLTAIAESCGARAIAGSDGTRASYTHAAVAPTARGARPGPDVTSDTGRLTGKGTENMAPIMKVGNSRVQHFVKRSRPISRYRNSRTRGRA